MTTHLQNLLSELSNLNLPVGEYVIVSSGVLAAKGIRECKDLDLLISKSLFDQLSQKYPVVETPTIFKIELSENIEALYKEHDSADPFPTEEQIKESEMIQGFPFQNLQTCLYFKENSDREKDKADVMLIKEYMNK
jgi:hypothetical protein